MNASPRKPRILYLINGFVRGGAEKGLLQLLLGGAFAGCDVSVLSIVVGQGAYVDAIREAGATVTHLSKRETMRMQDWLLAIPRFHRAMKAIDPDLVILSLPQANIAGRIAALAHPRSTIASFEHNTHLAKPLYEKLFRATSGRVDWLLADCVSTAHTAITRLYKKPPRRTLALPLVSFADADIADKVAAPNLERLFTVTSAGRFTSVKNQSAMIEAVRILKDRGMVIRLRLFGEGKLLDHCRGLAKALGVDDRVEFPGFDARWMMQDTDAFLVASHHEGLCIVALEAMSRGMPVVATRVGGLRDYGEDALVSFLETADPQHIADALEALMRDPGRLEAMQAAGAKMVVERFSDVATGRAYAQFAQDIHELVERPRVGQR
jgi:glycosyltransferase involved in cell wall biosynthesis